MFSNHILQHLAVWQYISYFPITALHDIQWDTCEYHLQGMYLHHKAIIGLIQSFIKARCCWIWRRSVYGDVTTCALKSLRNAYLTLTALINRASRTVAVKAKRICGATGVEPTKLDNCGMTAYMIKEELVNDAQMFRFYFLSAKTTCCCWGCRLQKTGMEEWSEK